MLTLHDPSYRESIKARLRLVKMGSPRKWGVMTPDQMMWHLAQSVKWYFGDLDVSGVKLPFPMPKAVVRFIVLDLPWPKGSPTMDSMRAATQYDLDAERARCLALIDEFVARPIEGEWLVHPLMGRMSGEQCSRLQAKHFNHHLQQFGA